MNSTHTNSANDDVILGAQQVNCRHSPIEFHNKRSSSIEHRLCAHFDSQKRFVIWFIQTIALWKRENEVNLLSESSINSWIVDLWSIFDSHWTPNDGLNDDDDAGDDEVTPQYGGLEATIYLIDVASIARNQNHFRLTLECIENDLLKTIMENRKDLAGIVFYNTEKSPEPHDESECEVATITPAHCAIYVPLKPLSKQSIAYFKGFVNSDDQSDFANRYGTNPNGKFHEALWLCSRLLCQSQYKVASSTIVLFTNNEQPHMPGSVDMQQAMRRAKDLADIDSNVWLVPMVDEFNYDLFYKEFLSNVADEDLDAFRHVEPCVARDTLLHRVTRKTNRKKCLRHLRLIIGDGLEIGCDLHSFIKVIKKPSAIKMLRTTNETLVAKRSYVVKRKDPDDVAAESGGEQSENVQTVTVMPGELFKYQAIGGQEIAFSAEEMTSLKTLVAPGLRLLGFKPIDKLSSRCFVKACAFLAPSDGDIKGSTKLFRALWEKCSEKEVYALCTLTYRRKVPPRYVALVPQTDNVDGKDGFRIVYVPMESKSMECCPPTWHMHEYNSIYFTADYNHLDVLDTEPPTVSDESVELLSKLCKKLRFVYTPDMFSNPSLQVTSYHRLLKFEWRRFRDFANFRNSTKN